MGGGGGGGGGGYIFVLSLTNRKQFSMDCTLIDYRNNLKMFKTQVEPQATDECFHSKVFNILTSFLYGR